MERDPNGWRPPPAPPGRGETAEEYLARHGLLAPPPARPTGGGPTTGRPEPRPAGGRHAPPPPPPAPRRPEAPRTAAAPPGRAQPAPGAGERRHAAPDRPDDGGGRHGRRAAPAPDAPRNGRRAAPEPPRNGRRAAPEPPPTGRRAAPQPNAPRNGRHAVPVRAAPRNGRRAAPDVEATTRLGAVAAAGHPLPPVDDPTERVAIVPARSDGPPPPTPAADTAATTTTATAGGRLRADRIDATLTRLTAAHAGLVLADDRPADAPPDAAAEDAAAPPAPPPPRAVRIGRAVAAAVALLLVVVSGTGWVGRTRLDGALQRVAAVDVPPDGVLDAPVQAGDRSVLVLATDGSAGDAGSAGTVVVVHTDTHTGRTVALALPPDLEITRPPCERWDATAAAYLDETVPAEPRTTLDSAYAVGGPRCATRAVQQLTGLAVTDFAAVDLTATSALVEAVGGVEVCVERPVLDAVVGPVLPTAGTSALNGARAGDLVRATEVRDDPEPGVDLVRRQQRVLAAALARALSPERLLHPGRVGRVLPALRTTVVSTGTGVADLLALSGRLGAAGTTLRAAPTEPATNSRGNRVLRPADAAALFGAVRTDAPLPPADPAAGAAALGPADVTADVLNASGGDGLAAEVAGTLGELGFRTAEVTNAPQPALDTVIRFSPDRARQAQLLAAAVPSATVVPDPGTSGVLRLVLGRSFDGTVRAPTAADPAPEATAPAVPC